MENLTIEQFCKLEILKLDLRSGDLSDCKYEEKIEDNLTVLEVKDPEGNTIKELIVVL